MTEAEWLACIDPKPMLEFLRGKASDRKLRLFACACVRRVWRLLTEEPSQRAVEVTEHYADGTASEDDLWDAGSSALSATEFYDTTSMDTASSCGGATAYCLTGRDQVSLGYAIRSASRAVELEALFGDTREDTAGVEDWAKAAKVSELAAQASLARDIFFRPLAFHPVKLAEGLLNWNDGCVVKLATAAYERRQLPAGTLESERLAVLADALEEAGCTDSEILTHLRGPGPHVRGCWAVDLLLGQS
jgi:hypothetical protein